MNKRYAIVACFLMATSFFITSCHLLKKQKNPQVSDLLKLSKEAKRKEIAEFERDMTMDPATQTIPSERLLIAMDYAQSLRKNQQKTRAAVSEMVWSERGPNNFGGVTKALLYDLNDATYKTVWAGALTGGLWKTTDITAPNIVWNKTDDFFSNLAVSALAQHPVNHDTIYFGTGDGYFGVQAVRGLGIWRSIDGGANWSQLPSTINSSFYYTQKIVIDSNGVVYAATLDGVQRSLDHGATWTKVLGYLVGGGQNNYIYDIEIGLDGDIYAGCNYYVYKSDHAIHGANTGSLGTWSDISPAVAFYQTEFMPSPSDSSIVYLICDDQDGIPSIYKSTNGGDIWNPVTSPVFCEFGAPNADFTRDQGFWNLTGAVDPNNPNTLYIGGIDAFKSIDGGLNWTQITSWNGPNVSGCTSPATYVHADHHGIVFKPGNSSEILWGTDGGIYRTTNSGASFTERNEGYNVAQFYSCAAHPTNPNFFLAGAQDNGTQRFTDSGVNSTIKVILGDGANCHIDQLNPNIQIGSNYYTTYHVSINGGYTFSYIGGNFNSGRPVSPTDYDDINKIMYGTYTYGLYEVIANVGVTNSRSTRDISAVVGQRNGSTIKIDPNNPTTIWMGYQTNNFPLSCLFVKIENASSPTPTVTNLSVGLPTTNNLYISSIDVETGNSNHILITYSNYGTNSIWESMDGGLTWNSVEGNLPDMPVYSILMHPDSNDMAFIATAVGVWSTNNLDGANTEWTPTNGGLANVSTRMLQYRASDHTLVAATLGRGLFTAVIPHTPQLNFQFPALTVNEKSTATIGCRSYKDYTIQATASFGSASPLIASVDINPGNTASEFLDFEYTSNGSFIAPSHQVVFSNGNTSVPITIRIYDDQTQEVVPEAFTLSFAILSGTAVMGTVPTLNIQINDNDDDPLAHRVTLLSEDFESGINPPAAWVLTGVNTNRWGNKNYVGCLTDINNYSMQVYNANTNSCQYATNAISTAYVHTLINASGYSNLKASFDWIGQGEVDYDSAVLVYSTNIVSPVWVTVPGGPSMVNSLTVVHAQVDLPPSLNNTSFLLGWKWVNDNNTGGISVGFDNVVVTGDSTRHIENVLSSDNEYLGPFGDIYAYSNNGDIIAHIQNLSNHDYGCTQIQIDRMGNNAQFITAEVDPLKKVFDKTILITPTNNNPAGNYGITLYVNNAEKNGFENEGRTWATQGKLFKMPIAVNNAIVSTPRDFASNLMTNTFLNGYSISGEFNTGFSGFGIGDPGPAYGAPLPTQLISFSGKLVNQHTLLNWVSVNELNVKQYEVERAADGIHFEKIGTVMANGKSQNEYTFEDINLIEPMYYYRLKIIDHDMNFTYSQWVLILTEKATDIVLFPNPATDHCTIYTSQLTKLKLLNTVGKTLRVFDVQGSYILDLKEYPAAIYYLQDSRNNKSYKLIKK